MECVKGQVENEAINRSVGGSGCNMTGLSLFIIVFIILFFFLSLLLPRAQNKQTIIPCLETDTLLTARQFQVHFPRKSDGRPVMFKVFVLTEMFFYSVFIVQLSGTLERTFP